ncbi:MAG: hypothetical protein VX464_00150 [Pseudomonadota bacterium]|nr:hypothetical protein [Pseudomonadota bacterium]
MSNKLGLSVVLAGFILAGPTIAAAEDIGQELLNYVKALKSETDSLNKRVTDLEKAPSGGSSDQTEEIAALRQKLMSIQKEISGLMLAASATDGASTNHNGLPRGAVIAFDLPTGCPEGWTEHPETKDRFVLGAGSTYRYRQTGGESKVRLTISNMPKHDHNLVATIDHGALNWDGKHPGPLNYPAKEKADDQWKEGESEPHNNMPPYVALYFCQKN